MSILNFPTTGLYNGYQYIGGNGITYVYDGAKWLGHIPSTTSSNSISNSGNIVEVNQDGDLVMPFYTLPATTGTFGEVLTWPVSGSVLKWSTSSGTTAGLPLGGTTGQILAKIDGTDFNTSWVNQPNRSDTANIAFYNDAIYNNVGNDLILSAIWDGGPGYNSITLPSDNSINPLVIKNWSNNDINIVTGNQTSNVWTFSGSGKLIFPDASTQTSAWNLSASVDWNQLTGTTPNVGIFTNDVEYLTSSTVLPFIPTVLSSFTNDVEYLTSSTVLPFIPTVLSSFTNDVGYITSSSLVQNSNIPTVLSSFTNDVGYITSSSLVQNSNIPTVLSSFTNDVGYISLATLPSISAFNNDAGYLTHSSNISYNNLTGVPFSIITQYLLTGQKVIALSTASLTSGNAANSGIQIGPITGSGAYATWTFDGTSNWQSSAGIIVGASGPLKVNSTATSLSTSSGAIIVKGGIGIGGNLYAGGNISAGANTMVAGTFQGNAYSSGGMNSAAAVGFLGMPQNAQSGTTYTLALSDQGKHVYASNLTSTLTIPANTVTSFPVGTTIAIIAGPTTTATITILSDTLYLGGSGTTGNRTLSPFGMATIVKVTSSSWFINGTGLN